MDLSISDSPYVDKLLLQSPMELDGSSFHPTPNPAHFTPQDSPSNISNASEPSIPKKKGRKGHNKSRAGCFNCKKARIKVGHSNPKRMSLFGWRNIKQCKENKPTCDYCAHRDLNCEWPNVHINQQNGAASLVVDNNNQMMRHDANLVMEPLSPLVIPMEPHIQGPVFTMQDFRLFQFFRNSAYPHQPIGNDSVWRHEIPCMASSVCVPTHFFVYLSLTKSITSMISSYTLCSPSPPLNSPPPPIQHLKWTPWRSPTALKRSHLLIPPYRVASQASKREMPCWPLASPCYFRAASSKMDWLSLWCL